MTKHFSKSCVATAVLLSLSSLAYGETFSYTSSDVITADKVPVYSASQNLTNGEGAQSVVYASGAGTSVQILSNTINVTQTVSKDGQFVYYAGVQAAATDKTENGAILQLGSADTDAINVNVNVAGIGTYDGGQLGHYAMGLWAFNTGNGNNDGGQLVVQGKSLVINVHSENGGAYGVIAQNGSTTSTSENKASITIDAENTYITVTSGEADSASGLVAMSQGHLTVNGNLYAKADSVLVARGGAVVRINESNDKIVQLTGDINFNYDKKTSNTSVDADVLVNLSGENSFWKGNAVTSYGTGQAEPSKMEVTGLKLGLSDGAQWTPTLVNESSSEDSGVAEIGINDLTLNDGVINLLEGEEQHINIANLHGTGGTINSRISKNTDGTFNSPKLSVETVSSDGATPSLTVKYEGITSDDLSNAQKDMESLAANITAAGADKSFVAEEGNLKGAATLTQNATGGFSQVSLAENTKLADFSSVSAMSLVQWRNEINHLTKRLGDIRASESTIGAWARVYGGASEWGENSAIEMDHTTIQVGGDYRVNPNWIVGAAFSYTDSDADLVNGQAEGESYSLAAYATYMADNGSYLDMIARYGYLKNDITAGNMILDTSNNAFSVSLEGGHMFRFMDDRAYIEPQVELTYGFVAGDDTTAANDVRVEQDDYQNLITRVGVRTGFDFPEKAGTIYAMLSYSYDFLGDADGTASGTTGNGYESVALREDLGGGWVSYGVGAQFRLGDNAFAYGELERTSGGDVDNPYLFNVGFRYNF